MKYKRLYKLNARQDDESSSWPESSRTISNHYNSSNQPQKNSNLQKVKSFMEAMQRVLTSGEQQQQQQQQQPGVSDNNRTKNLGLEKNQEEFKKIPEWKL